MKTPPSKSKVGGKERKSKKKECDRRRREKMTSDPNQLALLLQKEKLKFEAKLKEKQRKLLKEMTNREHRRQQKRLKKWSKTRYNRKNQENGLITHHEAPQPGGFRLPLDPELKLKWLEVIKWPIIPLEPKKTAIVCPTHFTEDDYSEGEDGANIGKHILKKDAIPSLFPWNSNLWSKEELEKHAAPRSLSTTDDEEDHISEDETSQSADSDIESGAERSSVEDCSEDEIVADDIVTISSDDDDPPPQSNTVDLRKSPETFWESSPACQVAVKRSAPSEPGGSHSGKQSPPKKRRYTIGSTISQSSSSSNEERPSGKPSTSQPTVIVVNTAIQGPLLPKTEENEDSDDDCILCENPIESIDLTRDDPMSPREIPQILFDESDSSDVVSEDLPDRAGDKGELSRGLLLDKSSKYHPDRRWSDIQDSSCGLLLDQSFTSSSEDSDCEIIEDNPLTIEIASDEEESPAAPTYAVFENKSSDSHEDVDPFAGVTNGEFDPLTGIPSQPNDPLADVHRDGATSQVPSSSGNLSPVASKEPNGSIVKKIRTTVRTIHNQQGKMTLAKKKTESLVPAEIPRDYEVVGIHPTSKSLRIVLVKKKKKNKQPAIRNSAPEKTEGSVDPLSACLPEEEPPVSSKSSMDQPKITNRRGQSFWTDALVDLAEEETHLSSVVLMRNMAGYEPHCEALAAKLSEMIKKSEIMAGRLSPETIMSMYKLLFLTEISYGIIYWGHCEGAHRIFELQKRFVGMLAHRGKPELKASRATFRQNGILTLPSIYILHCLIHVHKNLYLVKRHAALRLSENEGVKYLKQNNKTYEIQGLEFYLALPPHLHAYNLKKFIVVVKRFLKQNGIFNTLEYYDMASRFPKIVEKGSRRIKKVRCE